MGSKVVTVRGQQLRGSGNTYSKYRRTVVHPVFQLVLYFYVIEVHELSTCTAAV